MAETTTNSAKKRYAVVTGSNKGIGFEICRHLASTGIIVVLAARNEKKGLEAVKKISESGLSDYVAFHQLDVTNPGSIASFADFIKTQFGKLDILVNNAAIGGTKLDDDALRASGAAAGWSARMPVNQIQTYELAKECLETNYYGVKRTTEALIPLLQLSESPRIVNVSSGLGRLKNIPSKTVRGVLSDVKSLTEERVDKVLNEFLKDFKEGKGMLESKGWPRFLSAYIVSKAALNAYTRILAKKYPGFFINVANPGYAKTDLTFNTGFSTAEVAAETPIWVALLPDGGPSGLVFDRNEETSF